MMPFDHDFLTGFSKSIGLFYLIALSVGVLIYTYWPRNQQRFEKAAKDAIADDGDKPWR
jgi:cytochrome c oxidase cbb3-type subunit 4